MTKLAMDSEAQSFSMDFENLDSQEPPSKRPKQEDDRLARTVRSANLFDSLTLPLTNALLVAPSLFPALSSFFFPC